MPAVDRKPVKKPDAKPVETVDNDDFIVSLVSDMNKEFAESSQTLEDTLKAQVTLWVPSGNPVLDAKLGGGYPAGRVIEIFGPESNGKTTVALHALAETQKIGGVGIFLDSEHALDKRRARSIGIDLKKMIYAQPETMEDLFEYVEKIVLKVKEKDPNRLITIVWDSVAATPTKSEVEGEYGDAVMGIHARIMSQAFRKITKLISSQKVLFICINQIRDKMNVSYGEKTDTFGGRALKFYATQRLDVRRVETIKDSKGTPTGIKCKITVKKNKVAPPFGVADVDILFQEERGGMDAYGALLEGGYELGMFGSTKGYYEIDGKKHRKKDAVELLISDPDKFKMYIDTYLNMV